MRMSRISPEKEILYISKVIEKNIFYYDSCLKDKGFLSENILSQLRNLVEDVAILINNRENNLSFDEVNAFRHILDSYYRKEKYKAIYIIYSRFNEKHEVKPICEKLLPLEVKENSKNPAELH